MDAPGNQPAGRSEGEARPQELRILTPTQIATLFGCKARWAMRHWKELGGRKVGRKCVFIRENVEYALKCRSMQS